MAKYRFESCNGYFMIKTGYFQWGENGFVFKINRSGQALFWNKNNWMPVAGSGTRYRFMVQCNPLKNIRKMNRGISIRIYLTGTDSYTAEIDKVFRQARYELGYR